MAPVTPNETRRPTNPLAEEIVGGYFPVLDHGFVSLVDYMGSDEDVERAARVSYGAGTRKVSQTRGLVRYLRRHAHTTPSEMVELKFHCSMPIFVARQFVRHRTANINEYSGRYSLMPLLFYRPGPGEFAKQTSANNQGRESEPAPRELYDEAVRRWDDLRAAAGDTYSWLVGEDVARELARIDLPLSAYTQWYWKIDLHNLLHFLTLRVDQHAQWEIQEFARVMAGMLQRVAPISFEAWIDYDLMGCRMSAGELEIIRRLVRPEAVGDDDTVVRGSCTVDSGEMRAAGLSPREVAEFADKLGPDSRPDFSLDLTAMETAEAMSERMSRALASHRQL